MKIALLAVLVATCGCMSAGCDKVETLKKTAQEVIQDKGENGKAAKASDSDSQWEAKTQAYIRINNRLIDFTSSRNAQFAKWAAASEEKVKKGDFKSIRTDSHYFNEQTLKNLKNAIAMPAAMPEVDAAATTVLTTAEKYLPNWNSLIEYNKSKKYEDDAGANGKQLLPMYIEGIEALRKATHDLSAQVDVLAKQQHAKNLATYKAEGRLLEMHTSEATGAAEKIIEIFNDAKDFKDQAKVDEANAQLALLEASLEGMKTEHEKRKAAGTLPTIDRYDSVQSKLVAFCGDYREARKKPAQFNDAVRKYNEAIEELNRMR